MCKICKTSPNRQVCEQFSKYFSNSPFLVESGAVRQMGEAWSQCAGGDWGFSLSACKAVEERISREIEVVGGKRDRLGGMGREVWSRMQGMSTYGCVLEDLKCRKKVMEGVIENFYDNSPVMHLAFAADGYQKLFVNINNMLKEAEGKNGELKWGQKKIFDYLKGCAASAKECADAIGNFAIEMMEH